ncbi:uncharacterized protein LOC107851189 [Capsicum annuum]|uniref:uncharacterized protein LOC107851189 n=1 Tax=Capsicum annuum TaxID=4072 RepID=UPI001FB096E8|nr:uncharacterized protein LOC107851189 [Capsicum annuum]
MAASGCVHHKTLNPKAEEFIPTLHAIDLVPSLPHQIFHPVGNELVVYQPPPSVPVQGNEIVPYQQQPAPPVLPLLTYFPQPFYWICYKDVHVQPCYQQQVEVLSLPERSDHQEEPVNEVFLRKTWRRCGKRGAKRLPLPPRLVGAATAGEKTWKLRGCFMRKPHQEAGSISSYKATPLVKEGPILSSNLTTVMIRNIPNQFRREQFMLFVDHYCSIYHWEYDFLYLPIDFGLQHFVTHYFSFLNYTNDLLKEFFVKSSREYIYPMFSYWYYPYFHCFFIDDLLFLFTIFFSVCFDKFRTKNNVGYAFVNFTSVCAAAEIRKVLRNFKWHGVMTPAGIYSSRKICEVTSARIQGKEHLVKHFSGSNFVCETDEYLPVVFSPPRNGSTRLTKPRTIGKRAAVP